MLKSDLAAADVPYVDDSGHVADFHSFRHSFVLRNVASGASVKVCQELARHSTPALTIGRYAHARLHDLSQALEALPDFSGDGTDTETMRATDMDRKAGAVVSAVGAPSEAFGRMPAQRLRLANRESTGSEGGKPPGRTAVLTPCAGWRRMEAVRRRKAAWWRPRSSKPVWGSETVPGGFDSHPPPLDCARMTRSRLRTIGHERSETTSPTTAKQEAEGRAAAARRSNEAPAGVAVVLDRTQCAPGGAVSPGGGGHAPNQRDRS